MSAQPTLISVPHRAVFSDCGRYRYALWREWREPPVTRCLFVMLNPSVADDEKDDPTIRRCIKFSQRWGYDALDVANMFAFRTPSPAELWKAEEPVGRLNDEWIAKLTRRASKIVVAWGNGGNTDREERVLELLHDHRTPGLETWCLGLTDWGNPIHPLARGKYRVPDDVEPTMYPYVHRSEL